MIVHSATVLTASWRPTISISMSSTSRGLSDELSTRAASSKVDSSPTLRCRALALRCASVNRRAFSIAVAVWLAIVWHSSMSCSLKRRWRPMLSSPIEPITLSPTTNGIKAIERMSQSRNI